MSHASDAVNQFRENLRLFGPARTQPEKFNLYAGLCNVAEALKDLHDEVAQLRNQVTQLRGLLKSK